MTRDQSIAVAAVVIPCVTALLVGYLHRKQMRQIELFRQDPSLGVRSPPSPPVAFVKRHGALVAGIALPMLSVASLLATDRPATNATAALISLNVASTLITLQLHSELRLLKLLLKLTDISKEAFLVQDSQARGIAARLAEVERLVRHDGA